MVVAVEERQDAIPILLGDEGFLGRGVISGGGQVEQIDGIPADFGEVLIPTAFPLFDLAARDAAHHVGDEHDGVDALWALARLYRPRQRLLQEVLRVEPLQLGHAGGDALEARLVRGRQGCDGVDDIVGLRRFRRVVSSHLIVLLQQGLQSIRRVRCWDSDKGAEKALDVGILLVGAPTPMWAATLLEHWRYANMSTSTGDGYIDLEACAHGGGVPPGAQRFRIRIDGEVYRLDDSKPTGRQLLRLAAKSPVDEYLIFQVLRGGGLEELRLDETVDLRRPGLERFLTFESAASYRLVIDGERVEWGAAVITGLTLKKLAGVDPSAFAVWREVRGGEDILIGDDDFVDLSEDGLERFFTVIAETTAGACVLPSRDRAYLHDSDIAFEEVVEGGHRGLILKARDVKSAVLSAQAADILILLPGGYPDVAPDMFYCTPWLKVVSRDAYPDRADVEFRFAGRSWQRWSRHNNQWRPGKDGIWTMIKRVDAALVEAA